MQLINKTEVTLKCVNFFGSYKGGIPIQPQETATVPFESILLYYRKICLLSLVGGEMPLVAQNLILEGSNTELIVKERTFPPAEKMEGIDLFCVAELPKKIHIHNLLPYPLILRAYRFRCYLPSGKRTAMPTWHMSIVGNRKFLFENCNQLQHVPHAHWAGAHLSFY